MLPTDDSWDDLSLVWLPLCSREAGAPRLLLPHCSALDFIDALPWEGRGAGRDQNGTLFQRGTPWENDDSPVDGLDVVDDEFGDEKQPFICWG